MSLKMNEPRFAVMILLFNADKFILRTIDNCGPFVEKVFVSYSPVPWTAYNPNARKHIKNKSNKGVLDNIFGLNKKGKVSLRNKKALNSIFS